MASCRVPSVALWPPLLPRIWLTSEACNKDTSSTPGRVRSLVGLRHLADVLCCSPSTHMAARNPAHDGEYMSAVLGHRQARKCRSANKIQLDGPCSLPQGPSALRQTDGLHRICYSAISSSQRMPMLHFIVVTISSLSACQSEMCAYIQL